MIKHLRDLPLNNLPTGIPSCRYLAVFFIQKSSMDNKYTCAFSQSEHSKITTIWAPLGRLLSGKSLTTLCLTLALSPLTYAASMSASVYSTARQELLGTVTFVDSPYGLLITPQLTNLFPGPHGFHLHAVAKCSNKGADAGGHYDPANTNSHQGPYGKGHLGDLPVLVVGADSKASIPTLAPRLKTADLNGLSIMIHEGSDNYSDNPPMGGGGSRFACGVIKPSN